MTSAMAPEEAREALVAEQEGDVERATSGPQMTQSGCSSDVPIKPPVVLVFTTGAAVLLHLLVLPLDIFPESAPLLHLWYVRAPIGILILGALSFLFSRADHALVDAGSGTLFTKVEGIAREGPYGYSRNPMYLQALVGWIPTFAFVLNTWWEMAVCWVTMALYLRCKIIPAEERFMERHFEVEWDKYKEEVPRWIKMGPIRI